MIRFRIKTVLTIIFLGGVVFGTANASESDILPVRSVPQIHAPRLSEDSESSEFDGGGMIQRIGHDEQGKKIVVIGDRLLYFSNRVIYYDTDGEPITGMSFHQGSFVGYLLNENRQITELHLAHRRSETD